MRHAGAIAAGAALLAMQIADPARAFVLATTLDELARRADSIVVARVTDVTEDNYTRIATASVQETWKGPPREAVRFLAQPIWACDTSDAEAGETVVLFLNEIPPPPDRRWVFDLAMLESGAGPPVMQIAHNGRGRFPLRNVKGVSYAIWLGGVGMPLDTTVIPAPEGQDADPYWAVPLITVKDLVARALAPQPTPAQAADNG